MGTGGLAAFFGGKRRWGSMRRNFGINDGVIAEGATISPSAEDLALLHEEGE